MGKRGPTPAEEKTGYEDITVTGREPIYKKESPPCEWARVQAMRKSQPKGLVAGGNRVKVPLFAPMEFTKSGRGTVKRQNRVNKEDFNE